MASWEVSDSVVFGPSAAPTSWADLDLSSVVGSKRSLVWLHVNAGTGTGTVSARPGDDTDDWHDADNDYGRGCANVNYNVSVSDGGLFVMTDASGVIEWMASTANTFTITVIGYIDDVQTYSGAAVSTGALTGATWNNIDVSSIVGAKKAFVYLKINATNAWDTSENWFTKPHSDSSNWVNNLSFIGAAANKLNKADIDDSFGLIGLTNDSGILQIYSHLGNGQADVFVIGYIDEDNGWNDPTSGQEVVFGPAAMPAVYTDLDLSAAVGTKEVLAVLKLEQSGGNTNNVAIKTRENGKSYDHQGGLYSAGCVNFTLNRASMLICPCDSDGIIEWKANIAKGMTITVIGYLFKTPIGILSVVPGYLSLRVNFIGPMKNDAELIDPDNYTIEPNESDAVGAGVISVTPESDVTYPTYVDLEVQDLTHGKEYQLTITPNQLSNENDLPLVSPNTDLYDGVSVFPEIQTVTVISLTEVEVTFSKSMSPNADLTDETRYVFDNGLLAREVTVVGQGIVRVKTTKQTPTVLYTLTVS